jgi:hypothetical protein
MDYIYFGLQILTLVAIQAIIAIVFYSNLFFKKLYFDLSVNKNGSTALKPNPVKMLLSLFIKAFIVYFLIAKIALLLPGYFFIIICSIIVLIVFYDTDNSTWQNKNLKLTLLMALHTILSLGAMFSVGFLFFR